MRCHAIMAESWQMKWLVIPLAIQTLAGIALAFRSVSLNTWESSEGIHDRDDWLSLATGIVFLTGAGLGWYGYSQKMAWCWGFTGLRLLKTCMDAIGLVLLYFVFRAQSTAPTREKMSTFRYVLAWFYLILGVFDASVAIFIMPRIVMNSRPDVRHQLDLFLIYVAMHIFLFAAGIVFLLASWVLRADSVSGKRWVIAASLMNLFVSLGVSLLFLHVGGPSGLWSGVKLFMIPVAFGVAGLFAFPNSSNQREPPPSPAGPIRNT